LWATEVEGIAESDVAHRLGQSYPGREARRVAVRLAYLDLRRDLDVNCRETLRIVFGSSAGLERRAEDSHLGSCALCQAETQWLTDLGSALRSVPPAMPPEVWEEARRLALGDTRRPSLEPPRSDGAIQTGDAISAQPWPPAMDPRTRAVPVPSATDQAKAAVGDATNGCEPALVSRAAEAQKVKAEEVEAQQLAQKVVDHVVPR